MYKSPSSGKAYMGTVVKDGRCSHQHLAIICPTLNA